HWAPARPPAGPTGTTAALEGAARVHVRWSPNAEPDLAGYQVYRAFTSGGPYARLTGSLLVANDFVDASAPDTLALWYAVTAVDASGNESARGSAVRLFLRAAGIQPSHPSTPFPNPSPLST